MDFVGAIQRFIGDRRTAAATKTAGDAVTGFELARRIREPAYLLGPKARETGHDRAAVAAAGFTMAVRNPQRFAAGFEFYGAAIAMAGPYFIAHFVCSRFQSGSVSRFLQVIARSPLARG